MLLINGTRTTEYLYGGGALTPYLTPHTKLIQDGYRISESKTIKLLEKNSKENKN